MDKKSLFSLRTVLSTVLNTLAFLFSLLGFLDIPKGVVVEPFKYFTVLSGIYVGLISLINLILIFIKVKKPSFSVPTWYGYVKFGEVVATMLTFWVVVLVLNDGSMNMYAWSLSMCYHAICPLLAFLEFILCDDFTDIQWKYSPLSVYFVFVYGLIMIFLITGNVVTAPYFFIEFNTLPVWQSILNCFMLLAGSYVFSIITWYVKKFFIKIIK